MTGHYEALNNAAEFKKNFVVILNGNEHVHFPCNGRSLSMNLARMRTLGKYKNFKSACKSSLEESVYGNRIVDRMRKVKEGNQATGFIPRMMFEQMGM